MGESVAEATIIKWLKNEGDKIEADEPVLEIATDKVDSEVPSTAGGTLLKKMFAEGEVVQVGKVIAIIGAAGEKPTAQQTSPAPLKTESPLPPSSSPSPILTSEPKPATAIANGRFYSPLVRNIAQQEGIAQAELDTIPGTGAEGRVSKKDILSYLQNRNTPAVSQTQTSIPKPQITPPAPVMPQQTTSISGETEIIEMDRMRKLIAEHMVMSKHTSPHVTSFVEADVTNMVNWRNKVKDEFEKREKEKITFTPLFIEAVVRAIRDFPMINCSVDGTKIILKKNINIGMAAALPSGNLIVPVIKNADRLNLLGITKTVNDLTNRARKNKLTPDDIQGGTFTISNVGTFGNVMGTPIINQPQVAILAVGSIRKKPAVIETEYGDTIGIRQMMFLSLSYDHRVVDGMLGGSFLRRIADYLEQFDATRNIF